MVRRTPSTTLWNRLTPQFQNGVNNYYGYVDWWESVSYIEVDRLTILEQHQDTAIVDANLLYHLKKGSTYRDKKPLIYLVWDRTASRWLINNKQAK